MPGSPRALFDSLMSGTHDAILMLGDQHHALDWNEAARTMFGYADAETLGETIVMLCPPDRRDECAEQLVQLAAGASIGPVKTLRSAKNGDPLALSLRGFPVLYDSGRVTGAMRLHREAAAQLDTQDMQHLQALVSNSDDAFITKDLRGIITSRNRGAERILDWLAEEIIGRPMASVISAERQHEETTILARIAQGGKVDHFETELLRKDGSTVFV